MKETAFLPIRTQDVSISGVSAKTTLPVNTGVFRVISTVDCRVAVVASDGSATTSDMPLLSGMPEYFTATAETSYVAAITTGATGTMSVTDMRG